MVWLTSWGNDGKIESLMKAIESVKKCERRANVVGLGSMGGMPLWVLGWNSFDVDQNFLGLGQIFFGGVQNFLARVKIFLGQIFFAVGQLFFFNQVGFFIVVNSFIHSFISFNFKKAIVRSTKNLSTRMCKTFWCSQYFETFWCFTKFSSRHKWNDVRFLLVTMTCTSCLTSCKTT